MELGEGKGGEGRRMLSTPDAVLDQDSLCNFAARKLLVVVTGSWRLDEEPQAVQDAKVAVWTRDIYNNWEILICLLTAGHTGNQQGVLLSWRLAAK